MAEEWWTTPGEAARRLELLTEYYNRIRNAAHGRGVNPIVSSELADTVAAEVQNFQEWRAELGGFHLVTDWADELEDFTERANRLNALVSAELEEKGLAARAPAPMTEWHQTGPQTLLAGVQGLALAAIGLWLWSRRR